MRSATRTTSTTSRRKVACEVPTPPSIYSGAKHPVAAHLFLNHLLDAKVSASNTNTIGYMGPNEAAKEFIDPAILADPNVNPTKAILDKLEELLDMPNAVDNEYLTRWQSYTAGG